MEYSEHSGGGQAWVKSDAQKFSSHRHKKTYGQSAVDNGSLTRAVSAPQVAAQRHDLDPLTADRTARWPPIELSPVDDYSARKRYFCPGGLAAGGSSIGP